MKNELPYFEPEPMEELELEDPEVVQLLLQAARQRGMNPSDYLAGLVDCDRRGVKPRWHWQANEGKLSQR